MRTETSGQSWRGDETPHAMSKELLRHAVAYKIQEQEFGGLSRRTSLQLPELSNGGKIALVASSQLKPGSKLLRKWNDKVHEVSALEDGSYAYAGKVWIRPITPLRAAGSGDGSRGGGLGHTVLHDEPDRLYLFSFDRIPLQLSFDHGDGVGESTIRATNECGMAA